MSDKQQQKITQRDERIAELKQELRLERMIVVKGKDGQIKSLKTQVEKLIKLLKFVGVDLQEENVIRT